MNDESLRAIEQKLASGGSREAPPGLRQKVLADMQRELGAARWDRRLARAAVLLVGLGVGVNVAAVFHASGSRDARLARTLTTDSEPGLIATAVVVARATDKATARQYARWLAVMSGHNLSVDEAAAIDRAVRRSAMRGPSENEG